MFSLALVSNLFSPLSSFLTGALEAIPAWIWWILFAIVLVSLIGLLGNVFAFFKVLFEAILCIVVLPFRLILWLVKGIAALFRKS